MNKINTSNFTISAQDIREFSGYLRQCTDAQVRGVYQKEKAAGRDAARLVLAGLTKGIHMTDMALVKLRVAMARVAQACDPKVEVEIPGAEGRTGLDFTELTRLANERARGWNRLAACIVDHVENPSLDWLDKKLAEFP